MSATCSIQSFGGKRYEKPDNVKASMYVAMADVPAVAFHASDEVSLPAFFDPEP